MRAEFESVRVALGGLKIGIVLNTRIVMGTVRVRPARLAG